MKKNLLILSIIIYGTGIFAQVPSFVPSNGLVGWWPFNGNANDESGNGNNGSTTGTFSNDRNNSPNSAIALSGSSLISIPGGNSFDADTFSLSFWTLANSYNEHNKIQYGVIGSSLRFSMNWDVSRVYYWPMTCSGSYAPSRNYTTILGINTSTWYHITYVVQGLTTSFYINGSLIDVQSTASPLTCFNSSMNLYFGGDIGGGAIEYYSGLFDDIGFWTTPLNSQEIANLFNGCQISVNTQPTNQTININNNAQFVIGSSDPSATFQWQTDIGIGFQNLNSVGQYSGTNTNTLTVSNVTMSNNNQIFRCIVSSGSCSDTSDVAVLTVIDDLSVNEINNSKIIISPNPASDYFVVSASEELIGEAYRIIDLNGKTIKKGTLMQKEQKIEIGNLSEGMYLFKINHATEQTFRILKN